jgi:uncharacterized lipoprotein YehR (DUF1307 family)
MRKTFLKTALTLFLAIVMMTVSLSGCKSNEQAEYPVYSVVENVELGVIELHYNDLIYRPYGISDTKLRGKQIGVREADAESKICEAKGYDSKEWIVEYLDVFMGGGDTLYKAVGTTEIPTEIEQYKEYDY